MTSSMERPEAPNWIPDWRDDASYPARFEDWDLTQWAWAFLRRNAEYRKDYSMFAALAEDEARPAKKGLLENWGVGRLLNPNNSDGRDLMTGECFIIRSGPPEVKHLPLVTLTFDLRLGISTQVKWAERYLNDLRKNLKDGICPLPEKIKVPGLKRSELPKYLRAFDADLVGAKRSELGEKLYHDKTGESSKDSMKRAVAGAIKAGKALVSGGYKNL